MNVMNNKAVMNIEKCQPKRGAAALVNSPPPPRIFLERAGMVKKTLLLCVFLFAILALPVQSQTAVPTPPPAYTDNPTTLADCGLPEFSSQFTSSASIKTFNLTDDCVYGSWSAAVGNAIMYITSGEFTINGNGHSINGPDETFLFAVQGSSAILNLNDVIIYGSGAGQYAPLFVDNGARLNGRNLILRDNGARTVLVSRQNSARATLQNVQFLNNIQAPGSGTNFGVVTASLGGIATITNGIFRGNRNSAGRTAVVTAAGSGSSVTLNGCMTFEDNVQADGITPATDTGGSIITDSRTGRCPRNFSYWLALTPQKKPKKTPRPSATARPLATTCIDLNQATGIVVHATYGLASGVQCQRLDGGGIGVQAIVDGGFIDAVDIWGYVEQGVEVCFPQAGELLFLDARTMPRAVAPLAATVVNGMTCGAIETPGSIVLMPHS